MVCSDRQLFLQIQIVPYIKSMSHLLFLDRSLVLGPQVVPHRGQSASIIKNNHKIHLKHL